eukprot:TRINITY_DN10297_c0_g1_i2.p1 TRINITY_DN10297_c0_g1~~TRINITY_DN10297_c0_g1_i2.p1  ORF type:complete len:491 (+),score=66.64 TRINITY_DN10297_c0_g1_i2:61-1533(+)
MSRLLRFSDWTFPVQTIVGPGRRAEIRRLLDHVCMTPRCVSFNADKQKARRPLVVTDPHMTKLPWFEDFVEKIRGQDGTGSEKWDVAVFSKVHGNPLDTDVAEAVALYHEHGADCIVAVGGGSAMDAGKCVAMTAESGFHLQSPELDFFGDGDEVSAPPPSSGTQTNRLVPCVAVATTAGTGVEMDSASMITLTEKKEKYCVGHRYLPLAAVLDAETTLGLPATMTAWTGLDAVVHALEAYLVPELDQPLCDGSALQALVKLDRSIRRSVECAQEWSENGMKMIPFEQAVSQTASGYLVSDTYSEHLYVRQEMLVGSALAAIAFQRGLGGIHSLSEPIGAVFGNTHHGLTNAVLMPHVLRDLDEQFSKTNAGTRPYGQDLGLLRQEWLQKCADVSHVLRLSDRGSAYNTSPVTQVIDWAESLCQDLRIPEKLGTIIQPSGQEASQDHTFKFDESQLLEIAAKAERNPTGFGNAIRYTVDDYERVLQRSVQ